MSSPLHKHETTNRRLSGDGSAKARRHGGLFGAVRPKLFFVPPQILLCSEIYALNI